MSKLNTRDDHGYLLQGYDFVPKHKDTLSELVKLLQQANERAERLKDSVQYRKSKYEHLNQEYLAFKFKDLAKCVILSERLHHPEIPLLSVRIAVEIKTQQLV